MRNYKLKTDDDLTDVPTLAWGERKLLEFVRGTIATLEHRARQDWLYKVKIGVALNILLGKVKDSKGGIVPRGKAQEYCRRHKINWNEARRTRLLAEKVLPQLDKFKKRNPPPKVIALYQELGIEKKPNQPVGSQPIQPPEIKEPTGVAKAVGTRPITPPDNDDIELTARGQKKDNDERYTPWYLIKAAIEVMGGVDLDPFSSDRANEYLSQDDIIIGKYFSKEDRNEDGFTLPWSGRVWVNPPFSDGVRASLEKLLAEIQEGRVSEGLYLMGGKTGYFFYDKRYAPAAYVALDPRPEFFDPDTNTFAQSAAYGILIGYYGPNVAKFQEVFCKLGLVYTTYVGD